VNAKKMAAHVGNKVTPQLEKVLGMPQVQNSAGGFVFAVDNWKRLERFLILGTEGGTYYVGERPLTKDNAQAVLACLAENPVRTISTIVEISDSGRAPKNGPAILALILAAKSGHGTLALAALSKVCRIGTHLFEAAEYVKALGGWGSATRRAFGKWYLDRKIDSLAMQLIKYQQREGWSHRDILRKAHPGTDELDRKALFTWAAMTAKERNKAAESAPHSHPLVAAFHAAKSLTKKENLPELCKLITTHGLPHECVPNEMKQYPEVWEAMLPSMGLMACLRNLAKMTSVGLLVPLGSNNSEVIKKLSNVEEMKKARVHPMAILVGLRTYELGHGIKGKLTWTPVPQIIECLNDAFYSAFDAVEPSGKATMVAVDCSGSMSAPSSIPELSCREGAAAMAMVTVRTEPNSMAVGFSTTQGGAFGGKWGGGDPGLMPINLTKSMRITDAVQEAAEVPFGGTDCSLPMRIALKKKIPAEVFHVITDNETWAGPIHPFQALREYREKTGIPAKLVVVAMTATEFTIADPSDSGMLDVVGFDSSVPPVMADFARG